MLISTNPEKWFDEYDTNGSGTLTKDELIQSLCETLDVTDSAEKDKIKQSIIGVWCLFQSNDSDVISKDDFLKSDGIAKCLIALEKQKSSSGDDSNEDDKTQMVRVPIPDGMKEGKKLKLRTPGSSGTAVVYIPNEKQWGGGDDGKSYYFDVEIPLEVIRQSVILPEWISFDAYKVKDIYEAPTIGMKPVSYPVPAADVKPNGRRKALLIGINYTDTKGELKGCCDDVRSMKELLLKHGFTDDPSCILTLMEGDNAIDGAPMPTKENIQKGFDWLTHNVTPGDVLFFQFSGHGSQIEDSTGQEADGLNEAILPIDYLTAGEIVDDEIWGRLVYRLPTGVRLTAVMDCCHSGTGLDLPFTYDVPTYQWIEDENPAHSQGHVVLFSGCEDHDDAEDVLTKYSKGGAMTNAFVAAYDGGLSFSKFIDGLQFDLQGRGFSQIPQLSSTQKLSYNAIFSITDGLILGNANSNIGRGETVTHTRSVRPGRNTMHDILYYKKAVNMYSKDSDKEESEESDGDDI